LYIVIEDIDRSFEDGGKYFLETLKYFLNEYSDELSKLRIIILVPVSSYDGNQKNTKDTYDKVFDYTYEYTLFRVSYEEFIAKIFFDRANLTVADHHTIFLLNYFLEYYVHEGSLTIRELKREIKRVYTEYRTLSEDNKKGIRWELYLVLALYLPYVPLQSLAPDANYKNSNIVKDGSMKHWFRETIAGFILNKRPNELDQKEKKSTIVYSNDPDTDISYKKFVPERGPAEGRYAYQISKEYLLALRKYYI